MHENGHFSCIKNGSRPVPASLPRIVAAALQSALLGKKPQRSQTQDRMLFPPHPQGQAEPRAVETGRYLWEVHHEVAFPGKVVSACNPVSRHSHVHAHAHAQILACVSVLASWLRRVTWLTSPVFLRHWTPCWRPPFPSKRRAYCSVSSTSRGLEGPAWQVSGHPLFPGQSASQWGHRLLPGRPTPRPQAAEFVCLERAALASSDFASSCIQRQGSGIFHRVLETLPTGWHCGVSSLRPRA